MTNSWGAPQRDPQVNKAKVEDQWRKERENALRNDPARDLPTSVDRGKVAALLGLLRGLNPFRGDDAERRG